MGNIRGPEESIERDILTYKKILQIAKRDSKNIDDILKNLPPSKQKSYQRGKIAYKKLESAREHSFHAQDAKKEEPKNKLSQYEEALKFLAEGTNFSKLPENLQKSYREIDQKMSETLHTGSDPEKEKYLYAKALEFLAHDKPGDPSSSKQAPIPVKPVPLHPDAAPLCKQATPIIHIPSWRDYQFMDGHKTIDDLPPTLKYAYLKLHPKMQEGLKKADPEIKKYLLETANDLLNKGYSFKALPPVLQRTYFKTYPQKVQELKPKDRPLEVKKQLQDSLEKKQLTARDYELYKKVKEYLKEEAADTPDSPPAFKSLPKEWQKAYMKVLRAYGKTPEMTDEIDKIDEIIEPISQVNPKQKWTVLIYADGVNNLGAHINYTIEHLKQTGAPDGANVVIRHGGMNDAEFFDNKGLDRFLHNAWFSGWKVNDYVLTPSGKTQSPSIWKKLFNKGKINSWKNIAKFSIRAFLPQAGIYQDYKKYLDNKKTRHWEHMPGGAIAKDLDMGSEQTLSEFLVKGIKQYPADHTLIWIINHGGGHRGICIDDKTGNDINLNELGRALAKAVEANNGKPIDGIFFDACLMNQSEVASQIKDYVNCQIGSEQVGLVWGVTPLLPLVNIPSAKYIHRLPTYDNIYDFAKDMVNDRNLDPRTMASYRTISALNLRKMKFLENDLRSFANHVDKLDKEKDKVAITSLREAVSQTHKYFPIKGQLDLYDLMDKISQNDYLKRNYYALARDAEQIKTKVKDVVVAEKHKTFGLQTTGDILKPPDYRDIEATFPEHSEFIERYKWTIYLPYVWPVLLTSEKGSHGIGINLPSTYDHNLEPYHDAYDSKDEPTLKFLQATGWDRAIKKISEYEFDFRELDKND